MNYLVRRIVFAVTIMFELIALLLVIIFWRDLQVSFYISPDNFIAQVLFGNFLILGFLRALIICSVPIIMLLFFAMASKVLYSKTAKFGPLEFEEATENLTQAEIMQRDLDKTIEELRETRFENEQLKRLNEDLTEELYKSKKER
ncbi:MAG: hypothetical protein WBW16_09225 [Bacteroidota bacterium]